MDEPRFKSFFDQTARPLRSYLLGLCRDTMVCDDVFQESYVRFLQSTPGRIEESKWKSYLYAIATNILRDHWRYASRWKKTEQEADSGNPHMRFDEHLDARQGVELALSKLSPRERSLVWLAYVEAYSHREIAEIMHVRENSVRVLLFRAKQKLAGILDTLGMGKE